MQGSRTKYIIVITALCVLSMVLFIVGGEVYYARLYYLLYNMAIAISLYIIIGNSNIYFRRTVIIIMLLSDTVDIGLRILMYIPYNEIIKNDEIIKIILIYILKRIIPIVCVITALILSLSRKINKTRGALLIIKIMAGLIGIIYIVNIINNGSVYMYDLSKALMYLSAVLILWCDSTGALYRPAGNNAEAQLTDLKRRYEAGWLSDRQYKLKREEILKKL